MRKIAKKWICKNIIKILKIYQNSIEHDKFEFKNYLERTIYFEIDYVIKIIKEKECEING